MSTGALKKSRLYVGATIESTQGTAATLDTSFLISSGSIDRIEEQQADDVANGYLAASTRTRLLTKAGGSISFPLHSFGVGWALKMLFGAAPTSALVTPSTTVYEHVWNAFSAPATWTAVCQHAKLSGVLQQFAGNGIKSFGIKSSKGVLMVDVGIEGLGAAYQLGVSEPSVVPDTVTNVATSLPYLVGVRTTISKNGTPLTKGLYMSDWSVTVEPGYGLIDAAGSTDGSMTRWDITDDRKITADFTLLEQNNTNLSEFDAETTNTWLFQANGRVLDSGNSLSQLLSIQLNKARVIGSIPLPLAGKGILMTKMKVEALIDTATGFDTVVKLRSLDTTY